MRKVPLSPRSVEMLKEQHERFEKRFRRKSLPDEPIVFDSTAPGDTPVPLDPAKLLQQILDALRANGASEAVLYAVKKTGRILTAEAYAASPKHIRDEWDGALSDYRRQNGC